jgi:hypothetical protein
MHVKHHSLRQRNISFTCIRSLRQQCLPIHRTKRPFAQYRCLSPDDCDQCTAGCRDCQTKTTPPSENTVLRSHCRAIGAGSAGVPPYHNGGVFGRFKTGARQPTITSIGYNELKRGQPPTRMNNFSDSRVISQTRRQVQAWLGGPCRF